MRLASLSGSRPVLSFDQQGIPTAHQSGSGTDHGIVPFLECGISILELDFSGKAHQAAAWRMALSLRSLGVSPAPVLMKVSLHWQAPG